MSGGNTPEDAGLAVLRGIGDGDPAIPTPTQPPACPPAAGTAKPTWPATSAWTTRTSSRPAR